MRSVSEQLNEMHNEKQRENVANAKLKVAFATRGAVPKPTDVRFVSVGHAQTQMIYDDGSVRNPFKVNREMSGRQRRKLRKATNRVMASRGIKGNVSDVLKGRKGTFERPQPATQESPAPASQPDAASGTTVAAGVGD